MAERKWRQNAVIERLVIWFIFSVIVTLTPFFLGYFQSVDRDQRFTFSLILGGGQLFLVNVAIAAAALGDLVAIEVPAVQRLMKTAAIGSCTLVVIISSLWYGDISASSHGQAAPDPRTIGLGSVIVYSWALASSAWCLSLAARKVRLASINEDETRASAPLLRGMQQDKEKS
jgi:hypothetical protein